MKGNAIRTPNTYTHKNNNYNNSEYLENSRGYPKT
jgi:hypothetical protein